MPSCLTFPHPPASLSPSLVFSLSRYADVGLMQQQLSQPQASHASRESFKHGMKLKVTLWIRSENDGANHPSELDGRGGEGGKGKRRPCFRHASKTGLSRWTGVFSAGAGSPRVLFLSALASPQRAARRRRLLVQALEPRSLCQPFFEATDIPLGPGPGPSTLGASDAPGEPGEPGGSEPGHTGGEQRRAYPSVSLFVSLFVC